MTMLFFHFHDDFKGCVSLRRHRRSGRRRAEASLANWNLGLDDAGAPPLAGQLRAWVGKEVVDVFTFSGRFLFSKKRRFLFGGDSLVSNSSPVSLGH